MTTSKKINILFINSSIILFIYLFYKSSFEDFEKFTFYLKYILISCCFIIFSILLFFFKEQTLKKIHLLIFSLIFSFYLIELLINIYEINSFKPKEIYPRNYYIEKALLKRSIKIEERNVKKFYIENFKKVFKNPSFYGLYFPSKNNTLEVDIFPFSGLAFSDVLHCNENGFFSHYKTDRYGFNNPDDNIWNENEIDAVLIGDSFGNGACVNYEDSVSGLLKKNYKIINLSYDGNGPLINISALQEYIFNNKDIKKINNLIFFYFEGNDLPNLHEELMSKILNKYLNNVNFKQDLIKKNSLIQKINTHLQDDFNKLKSYSKSQNSNEKLILLKNNNRKNFNLINFLKLADFRNNAIEIFFPPPPPNWESFAKIVSNLKYFEEQKRFKLHFVYLPSWETYKYNRDYHYKKIKKYLLKENINFIDIRNEFQNYKNPIEFFPNHVDYHYTKEGYKILYNSIIKSLNKD